jgi:UDP-N-acetylglucosamine/UDP-N-acetylgalactosamine diphosphorylase
LTAETKVCTLRGMPGASQTPADAVARLVGAGVTIPAPQAVTVSPEVDVRRIAPGVVLHPGCRLSGADTSIGPGCVLGEEGPAVVEDCRLGAAVRLKGGYFAGATFLDGVALGPAAHVRPGTLLEEHASGAHAVGLKQTILFPFVALGSLINFCDCLMAGGTSRRRHGEVGSSYVHFNFTPHGDKATASLLGDVPRGVMLDQPPVFLGGQGGMVGPARVAFGTVIAAGTVLRGDVEKSERLVIGRSSSGGVEVPFRQGEYGEIARVVSHCITYLGNLFALRAWYRDVRAPRRREDPFGAACCEGALSCLETCIRERLKRLDQLAESVGKPPGRPAHETRLEPEVAAGQKRFVEGWPEARARLLAEDLAAGAGAAAREEFLAALPPPVPGGAGRPAEPHHVAMIQGLPEDRRARGTAWLQAVVDAVREAGRPAIPGSA